MLSKNKLVRNLSYILIILLLIGSVSATDNLLSGSDYPFNYKTLNIDLDIIGNITLTGQYVMVNRVDIKLNQFPKQSENRVFDFFNPYPTYQQTDESVNFFYTSNNIQENLAYQIFSRFTNSKDKKKITKDPNFPIASIGSQYSEYLLETENIDSTPSMKSKASSLVRNSDGVFHAAVEIAKWVNENIEYEINYETENNIKKASWAYENRKGVCDEKTAVFISMARYVGIPTRYISGIAYTNILKEFGHHAWAETYFPDYGWVPFDVTYGQFGWTDSSHISLSKSIDSKLSTVEVTSTGTGNSNVIMGPVDFQTKVIKTGTYSFPDVNIELKKLSDEIGYGSYNVIEAEITNNEEGYSVIEIFTSKVEGMEFLDNNKRFILIPPKKSETVAWAIKVSNELESGASYRFPFNVYLTTNQSKTTYFNVTSKGIIYSETYINNLMNNFDDSQINAYAEFIETDCNINRIFITNETSTINCTLNNNAVDELDIIELCFQSECKTVDFGEEIETNIEFNPIFKEIGLQTLILNISNNNIHKNEYLNFNIKDAPIIETNITAPETALFDDLFYINIDLKVNSHSRPKKLKVLFSGSGREQEWNFASFDIDQRISIETKGKDLFKDDNTFIVNLQWQDDLRRNYTEEQEIKIKLIDLNYWQELYAFVNKIVNN